MLLKTQVNRVGVGSEEDSQRGRLKEDRSAAGQTLDWDMGVKRDACSLERAGRPS